MAKTLPHIKKMPKDETVFYVYRLSPAEYLLYDSSMGDPLARGSLALISGKLDLHAKEINKNIPDITKKKNITVWKLIRDNTKGWKIQDKLNGIDYETPKTNGIIKEVVPISPLKDIGYEPIYFWIDMGTTNYIYDFDMGSPIWYGSPSKIKGVILAHTKRHAFSVILFYLPPKSIKPTYKLSIKYNTDPAEERKELKEKKKEEDQEKEKKTEEKEPKQQ